MLGQQNEIAAGAASPKPEDRIQKPEPLIRYEMAKSLGVPYVAGGLMDQPYIWMQEHAAIENALEQWASIHAALAQGSGGGK
jgi:hypothetical protein